MFEGVGFVLRAWAGLNGPGELGRQLGAQVKANETGNTTDKAR